MNQFCSCRVASPCANCIFRAKQKLTTSSDGPITDFVVISRGCALANKEFSSEVIANAISEVLEDYGFIKTENPVLMTGS